ncbi:hypothetical protein [Streptomyces sp. NPDC059072]|uniref:hypothetical protein n=1 Tax=Streptomyces sp. NPDC059072 TaxID=3346715 RepID=UPI0036BC4171
MGIESDHLVYEYLSRVGDLAQRRQLSSGDRMRLVAGLRDEIDSRRAKYDPDTPAAVRRILERLGTPEEVLDRLGSGSGSGGGSASGSGSGFGSGFGSGSGAGSASSVAPAAVPAVPVQRGPGLLRRKGASSQRPAPEPQNVPPHLAGLDELGPSDGAEPDWWRVAPSAYGRGPQVEGFAGGIEIPDLFKEGQEEDEDAADASTGPKTGAGGAEGGRGRTLVRFLRDRRRAKREAASAEPAAEETPAARPRPNAFLLLAAAVLLAGVISGYWLLLVVGWLLPYASRTLGPSERKWTVIGPPSVVLTGAVVWVWGRMNGRWGEALPHDQLSTALQGMWPWLLRGAGIASAAYLVWRARRR